MKKSVLIVVSSLILSLLSLSTLAQPKPPTPEEQAAMAVKTRQAVFDLISWNLGQMRGMMLPANRGGTAFDAPLAEKGAKRIATLAQMIPEVFALDTSGFKVETRAQERIWKGLDDFADHAKKLESAANEVAKLAAAGDEQATVAALRSMGQTCGSCHDIYRKDL